MKLFGKIFYWVVFIVILAVAFLVMGSSVNIGGARMFYVSSPSMESAIHPGTLIFVKPEADYNEGDIITKSTSQKDTTVTHRIFKKETDEKGEIIFTLKGDANEIPDEGTITQGAILGKVFFRIPLLGYLVAFAKQPIGFILLVVIPVTIIIYDEVLNIRDEIRKQLRKRKSLHKKEANETGNDEGK